MTVQTNNIQLDVRKLIDVAAPYFALKHIEIHLGNKIKAQVPIEKEIGFELTYMANSETGRHLAI